MHSIEYGREAAKTLARLPRNVRELIVEKLATLATDLYAANNNVAQLQGRPEYRLRVHDWRVIYRVIDDAIVILVVKIGARGDVYR